MNALLISNVKVSAIIVMATLLIGASFSGQLARAEQPEAQSMFYKARSPETGNMWDVWVYLHEGTYYLYHLAQTGKKWDNISMASSPDGVHWKEIGPVLLKDPKAVWMGTGSTWKSPNFAKDGKFFINFSQQFPDQPQTIFFGESTDLIHWNCGTPDHSGILRLARAILIPPRQNIKCTAQIVALPAGGNQAVFGSTQGARNMLSLVSNLNAVDLVNKCIAFCFDGLFSRDVQ